MTETLELLDITGALKVGTHKGTSPGKTKSEWSCQESILGPSDY